MELLQVKNGLIVTASGRPVRLRGFNIGGWLNMEDFIDGFPGAEHNLRATLARILGQEKAKFFFDRLLDYFFTEDDAIFMKELGVNVLRLPFNYRHFERDDRPFEYLEAGFRRLDQALAWCGQHGIYVILDFHAVQGWHNPDWHSDNAHVHILLYNHKLFQDRFVALWEEIAHRYKDNPTIAGYGLMNEPCTRLEYEQYDPSYYDWDGLNSVHRRAAQAIRAVDPNHIIFLEGDNFSTEYDGLDVTFAPNIVVETHNYIAPTIGPGPYPGLLHDTFWNRDIIAAEFGRHSGTRLAFKHRLPVFAGEFGVTYRRFPEEIGYRALALDDQIGVFDSAEAHWAIWTFKDVGVMGSVHVHPDCEYLRLIAPLVASKENLATWGGDMPTSPVAQKMWELVQAMDSVLDENGIAYRIERQRFAQFLMFGYVAQFLQVPYAYLFKDKSETEIDRILQAFAFKNCQPNEPLITVLKRHLQA